MPPTRSGMTTRACDSCRHRKVKCDASAVCANCRTSQLLCQYTTATMKRGPKVPRIRGLGVSAEEQQVVTHRQSIPPRPTTAELERSVVAGLTLMETNNAANSPNTTNSPRTSHTSHDPPHTPHTLYTSPQIPLPQMAGALENAFGLSSPSPLLAPPSMAQKSQAIRHNLLLLITSAPSSVPPLEAVNSCIDLYMQYTFPTAPIVHEPTLRESATRFFSSTEITTEMFRIHSRQEEILDLRAFALLTALCASVSAVMPESLLVYRQILARPCLNASREITKIIEDFDIEQPNSTSIAIRILHATALEHIKGDATLSYYILGQATLLIRRMRLHDEDAIKSHDAIEAQLLRSLFWQVYAADQASACLGNRPFFLHELLFDGELSVHPHGGTIMPMLDSTKSWSGEVFEERILIGFHFLPRLWSSAAKLLSEIRIHGKGNLSADKTHLTQKYMQFLGILDRLPYWLQAGNVIMSRDDGEGTQFQKTAFWTQRCTILVTFQCLRLVILQQCIDSKVWNVMGLDGQALTLSMVKIGIVNDFLQTLDDIPFIYLQVKGEPTVQRVRRVGSALLEILDNVTDEIIVVRAEHYFARLLDILARLDSKSSTVLAEMKELGQMRFESTWAAG